MEQIISIGEQILIIVGLCLSAGFLIGWLSVRAKYKSKYDIEMTREFYKRKPLYEWHTTIPCPGAFLLCQIANNRLIYGYAISLDGEVGLMQLPNRVDVKDKSITPRFIPFDGIVKWSYAEDHPIYPVETLKPFSQSYK